MAKKKFVLSYRDEFTITITAPSFEAAVEQACLLEGGWRCTGELHRDMFEDVTDEGYDDDQPPE